MKKNVVVDSAKLPIQPSDIDTSDHFWDSFGKTERECTARWLVLFSQERGSWEPFSDKELQKFYSQRFPGKELWLGGLMGDGFLVEHDGIFFFTAQFVGRCYTSRPGIRGLTGAIAKESE